MSLLPASLSQKLETGEPVVGIGLMSGTSADGIDAAAVRLWREDGRLRFQQLAFRSSPYPDEIHALLDRCFADRAAPSEICELNQTLGDLFADAALQIANEVDSVDFVASHGQTIWHRPPAKGGVQAGATLQLGEAARIAARLGVPVVSDFRQQDMALGGQGAPLVPYVDYLLFSSPDESRAIQNLGGIGNVTYLPAGEGPEEIVAFDTGPANVWIDAAAALVTGGAQSCDVDGRLAASAPVDLAILQVLMSEPYFHQPPPKSTGRELFTQERVQLWWDEGYRSPELISTLTQVTVDSIADAYRRWLGPIDTVILGGGGARNTELVRRLSEALAPARVRLASDFGCDPDAKEAVAFAVLGYETLRGRPSNVPSATGAASSTMQGKVCVAGVVE